MGQKGMSRAEAEQDWERSNVGQGARQGRGKAGQGRSGTSTATSMY
jgi:hypothetical protein